jgi:hypothetical protein
MKHLTMAWIALSLIAGRPSAAGDLDDGIRIDEPIDDSIGRSITEINKSYLRVQPKGGMSRRDMEKVLKGSGVANVGGIVCLPGAECKGDMIVNSTNRNVTNVSGD